MASELKVISWNINSINIRLEHLTTLVQDQSPDVILLQELKCLEEKFPFEYVEDLGYNSYVYGQKSYNGVAILSKTPVEDINKGLYLQDEQARFISGYVAMGKEMVKVASVYVPNGADPKSEKFEYKMQFFANLRNSLKQDCDAGEKMLLGGDLNVAPEPIDVYNPKALDGKIGFHIEERKWFRRLEEAGYHDSYRIMNSQHQEFSWWDYRTKGWEQGRGMRIDHIMVSSHTLQHLKAAGILCDYRALQRPSDHAPTYIVVG